MLALLFIVLITALSILISYHFSPEPEPTWFTYNIGGVVGLFVSATVIHYWNKRRRKKEEEEKKKIK